MDTLDYSGSGLNKGSKVVIAAAGEPRRELPTEISGDVTLPDGFREPRICFPGVLAVQGPPWSQAATAKDDRVERFAAGFRCEDSINRFPLIVVVDDADFAAQQLKNFLWVTFTRSNPASDIHGIEASIEDKHWGCRGSVVIDARIKSHHAPPLIEDPTVTRRVNELAAPGGPLHGLF